MSRKDELIDIIESSYPADDSDSVVREIGKSLMSAAILEVSDWRLLPNKILESYANKCLSDEQKTDIL